MQRIFVYGTLKRGCSNHAFLGGQNFVSEAQTQPRYRMYDLGGYPGMIEVSEGGIGIRGEVWDVDPACLKQLDLLEDIDGGEYARVAIAMDSPPLFGPVEGYVYLWPVASKPEVGAEW